MIGKYNILLILLDLDRFLTSNECAGKACGVSCVLDWSDGPMVYPMACDSKGKCTADYGNLGCGVPVHNLARGCCVDGRGSCCRG